RVVVERHFREEQCAQVGSDKRFENCGTAIDVAAELRLGVIERLAHSWVLRALPREHEDNFGRRRFRLCTRDIGGAERSDGFMAIGGGDRRPYIEGATTGLNRVRDIAQFERWILFETVSKGRCHARE